MIDMISNFVRGLGNIPKSIDNNFGSLFNTQFKEDDFYLLPENERQKAVERSRQFDRPNAFLRALQTSLPFFQQGTTRNVNFNAIANAVNNLINQKTQAKTFAQQQEFDRILKPLQMKQLQANINAMNRKDRAQPVDLMGGLTSGNVSPQPSLDPSDVTNLPNQINNLSPLNQNNNLGNFSVNTTPFSGDTNLPDNVDVKITPDDLYKNFINESDLFTRGVVNTQKGNTVLQTSASKTIERNARLAESGKKARNYMLDMIAENPSLNNAFDNSDFLRLVDIYNSKTTDALEANLKSYRETINNRFDRSNYGFLEGSAFDTFSKNNVGLFNFNSADGQLDKNKINFIQDLNEVVTAYQVMRSDGSNLRNDNDKRIKKKLAEMATTYGISALKDFNYRGNAQQINDFIVKQIEEPTFGTVNVEDIKENVDSIEDSIDKDFNKKQIEENEVFDMEKEKKNLLFKKPYKRFDVRRIIRDGNKGNKAIEYYVRNNILDGENLIGKEYKEARQKAFTNLKDDLDSALNAIPKLTKFKTEVDALKKYVKKEKGQWVPTDELRKISKGFNFRPLASAEAIYKELMNVEGFDKIISTLGIIESHVFLKSIGDLQDNNNRGSTGLGALSNIEGGTIKQTIGDLGIVRDANGTLIGIKIKSTGFMTELFGKIIDQTENAEMEIVEFFDETYGIKF
jgi:hypothetical protein